MKVPFGFCASAYKHGRALEMVSWDFGKLINGHTLLIGMSGAGKTFQLKRLIAGMQAQSSGRTRFHVFDVHGDIDIPNASEVIFAELTPYGLNPLRVNPDPYFGGVRKCIQNFIKTINKATSSPLGVKQEAVIRNVLTDVYRSHGFNPDDPRTWVVNEHDAHLVSDGSDNRLYLDCPYEDKDAARALGARWDGGKSLWWVHADQYRDGLLRWPPKTVGRTHPTLNDVLIYANRLLKISFMGADQDAVTNLEIFSRHASAHQKRQIDAVRSGREREDPIALEALDKARDNAIDSYVRYVNTIRTGNEFDSLIKYDSTEVLKSVVDRLEGLRATGLFKGTPAPFDYDAPVWTYKLHALRPEEKKMFVLFRLQEIFAEAIQRGEQKSIRDVLILDEAHLYVDNDENNILSTLARESRKFGVALIAANQNADLPDAFLSSLATKMVLGIDEMYWRTAASKMRIEERMLSWIRPWEFMALQMKETGSTRNDWRWVMLPPNDGGNLKLKKEDLNAVPPPRSVG